MSDNREPIKHWMRLADVLAWQPQLSEKEVRSWEQLGIVHPWRKHRTAQRWYSREEIKKVLHGE